MQAGSVLRNKGMAYARTITLPNRLANLFHLVLSQQHDLRSTMVRRLRQQEGHPKASDSVQNCTTWWDDGVSELSLTRDCEN